MDDRILSLNSSNCFLFIHSYLNCKLHQMYLIKLEYLILNQNQMNLLIFEIDPQYN